MLDAYVSSQLQAACRSGGQVPRGLAKHAFLLTSPPWVTQRFPNQENVHIVLRLVGLRDLPKKDWLNSNTMYSNATVSFPHTHTHTLNFQFLYQLLHVFHPVGATLPVLIITYKTVTVNFMASILSLQGSGAAHKLS